MKADSSRLEWMASHVFGVEWYGEEEGVHETVILWWEYDPEDRHHMTGIGPSAAAALRTAVDAAMKAMSVEKHKARTERAGARLNTMDTQTQADGERGIALALTVALDALEASDKAVTEARGLCDTRPRLEAMWRVLEAWAEVKKARRESGASPTSADKMSVHWPPSYRGRIPVKVRMACDLGPDMWVILGRGTPRHWVKNNDELLVKVNQHGAMSVVTPYGDLGVKPLECEIIEWRAPNESGAVNCSASLRVWIARRIREARRWMRCLKRKGLLTSFTIGCAEGQIGVLVKLGRTPLARKNPA